MNSSPRNSRLGRFATLGALALFSCAATSLSALEPLVVAPATTEVVARINVTQSLQAPLADLLIDLKGRQQIESGAKLIQNLTDVNLFKDLYEVWLFAKIDDNKEVLVLARGNFNKTKLVDLLKINATYKETAYMGETVYNWVDEKDGPRYAVFIDQYLAIGGSNEIINGVIDRKTATTGGYQTTAVGSGIPKDFANKDFWAVIATERHNKIEFGAFSEAVDLKCLLITGQHSATGLTLDAVAVPTNPEATAHYKSIAEGGLAVSKLLKEEFPPAKLIAELATVSVSGPTLVVNATLSNEEVIELIRNAQDF